MRFLNIHLLDTRSDSVLSGPNELKLGSKSELFRRRIWMWWKWKKKHGYISIRTVLFFLCVCVLDLQMMPRRRNLVYWVLAFVVVRPLVNFISRVIAIFVHTVYGENMIMVIWIKVHTLTRCGQKTARICKFRGLHESDCQTLFIFFFLLRWYEVWK